MSDDPTTNPSRTIITAVSSPSSQKSDPRACLVVIYGDDLGRRVELGTSALLIGRSATCNLQIDQESVSRQHCEIVYADGGYHLRDLDSTNGSYVNDAAAKFVRLHDGDQVKIGRSILKFIVGTNVEGQYHEVIYRLMTIDGLTQLANRRYFEEALEREISRASRYKRPFSLILFDVDHFKQVNDRYGHLAGDAVLRQLGTLVRAKVRRDDIVARTGGEEFAILAPEVDIVGATDLAKKLNKLVANTRFDFDDTAIEVRISLGVAEWSPSGSGLAEEIVRIADERLYEAKRAGRDCVVSDARFS